MSKEKRQQYRAGAVVKVELSDGRLAFGRLLPGVASVINIFDLIETQNSIPSINEIISKPILFYCGLYRNIITKGIFEIIGIKEFNEEEKKTLPAFYKQNLVNINYCLIYLVSGEERKANPQECIGLECSSVWDEQGIVQRIKDHYSGKKNFHVELDKVILSKEDPRYLAPPQALRWDFAKQEFYRTDK
jgi:hypothetical protein